MVRLSTPDKYVVTDIQNELKAVEKLIHQVPDRLDSPLRDVIRTQIQSDDQLIRAWFVLAAGTNPDQASDIREKRIFLATALETLSLALSIHKYLIPTQSAPTRDEQPEQSEQEKNLVGSLILAGDYCFSRSAEFAARTDDAKVVSIFSQALMQVSEGHLQSIQEVQNNEYDDLDTLLSAGTRAAIQLCGLDGDAAQVVLSLSQQLSAGLVPSLARQDSAKPGAQSGSPLLESFRPESLTNLRQTLNEMSAGQRERWELLIQTLIEPSFVVIPAN